jgi:hypothetical protein
MAEISSSTVFDRSNVSGPSSLHVLSLCVPPEKLHEIMGAYDYIGMRFHTYAPRRRRDLRPRTRKRAGKKEAGEPSGSDRHI